MRKIRVDGHEWDVRRSGSGITVLDEVGRPIATAPTRAEVAAAVKAHLARRPT